MDGSPMAMLGQPRFAGCLFHFAGCRYLPITRIENVRNANAAE